MNDGTVAGGLDRIQQVRDRPGHDAGDQEAAQQDDQKAAYWGAPINQASAAVSAGRRASPLCVPLHPCVSPLPLLDSARDGRRRALHVHT